MADKKWFLIVVEQIEIQNIFVEASTKEEAEKLAMDGEGEPSAPVTTGWHIKHSEEKSGTETCAYCGGGPVGSVMIHRDGYGKGPLVPLCEVCGEPSSVTGLSNEKIWERISQGADTKG